MRIEAPRFALSFDMDFFNKFDSHMETLFASGWQDFKLKLLDNFSIILYVSAAVLVPALFLIVLQDHWDIEHPQPIGCKRIGLRGRSNLEDEQNPQYNGTPPAKVNRVKALFIYPVKSCKPVELARGEVDRIGMRYDRNFSFAQQEEDAAGTKAPGRQWKFLTQRTFPRLALVSVQLWVPDDTNAQYKADREVIRNGGCLIISFPFVPTRWWGLDGLKAIFGSLKSKYIRGDWAAKATVTFEVPYLPTVERIKAKAYGPMENMIIWKENPAAINMGNEVAPEVWTQLQRFLGVEKPMTLFRADTNNYREVFRCAPRKEVIGYQPVIGFTDAYPLHMLNVASVQDLASRLPDGHGDGFSVVRFRANIIVVGPAPNAEQDWKRIRVGATEYDVSCRTIRCKLPNVDPDTGVADRNEPYTTMSKYRCIDEGAKLKPALGMQMVPISGDSQDIKVGDEVEVLETGPHKYIKQ